MISGPCGQELPQLGSPSTRQAAVSPGSAGLPAPAVHLGGHVAPLELLVSWKKDQDAMITTLHAHLLFSCNDNFCSSLSQSSSHSYFLFCCNDRTLTDLCHNHLSTHIFCSATKAIFCLSFPIYFLASYINQASK